VKIPSKQIKEIQVEDKESTTINYSPSGELLATCGADRVVKVWDSSNLKKKINLLGSEDTIYSVAFSKNEEFLLGCSSDCKARIWSLKNEKIVHWLTGHFDKIYSGIWNEDKVITGSLDKSIKVWDYNRGYCLRTIFCYSGCTSIAAVDKTSIVSGHLDGALRLWDSRNGDCIRNLVFHTGNITSVSVSPDNRYILTNSRDNSLSLIDMNTFQVIHKLSHKKYQNPVLWSRASLSPDGNIISAGTQSGAVFCWDSTTGVISKKLKNIKNRPVISINWHPDGGTMAFCNQSGYLFLWT